MRSLPLLLILSLVIFSPQSVSSQDNSASQVRSELIRTEQEFSRMSKEKGMRAAFLAYVADDGVMLRPNAYPLEGKAAITEQLMKRPDSTFTLTWRPLFADAASSGELGYTYGTYELTLKDTKADTNQFYGTYATVWKKDKNGKWKFVLDVGNEGLSKEAKP